MQKSLFDVDKTKSGPVRDLPAASGDSVRQIDCKTEEEFIMSMIRVENITFSYP